MLPKTQNEIKVFIVSATYRDAVRVMTEGVLDEYVPAERDYGDVEKAEKFKKECEESGFYTVSEKDEFAALYPEGVAMKQRPKSE